MERKPWSETHGRQQQSSSQRVKGMVCELRDGYEIKSTACRVEKSCALCRQPTLTSSIHV